jgi:hypothetical protein
VTRVEPRVRSRNDEPRARARGAWAHRVAECRAWNVRVLRPVLAHRARSGNLDQDDVAHLTTVIGGGEDPVGIDPDFNRDGYADQDDITALIHDVGGGPCP